MTSPTKRIFIVAGEESGDQHAAHFLSRLLSKHPTLQARAVGGLHLKAAGAELISDIAKHGVTGATEVLRHALTLRRAYTQVQKELREQRPDLLVLVDYPGFNLRLAKYAKKALGLQVLYYISPQIWAWKAGRIRHIRKYVDHMAVILPFEKTLYQQAQIPVSFVGHPLIERLPESIDPPKLRASLGMEQEGQWLALLPGSRQNELARHLPILLAFAKALGKRYPKLRFIMPIASSIDPKRIEQAFTAEQVPIQLVSGQAMSVMAAADFVVVASGTASMEAALLMKPMCIIYKVSLLSQLIAAKVIRVPYLGLCNILAKRMLVPELLQEDCSAKELAKQMQQIMEQPEYQENMRENLRLLRQRLSASAADCSIEELIENKIGLLS